MNMLRVAGVALVAALALFLLSVLIKMLLIVAGIALLARVGGRMLYRFYGPLGPKRWNSGNIISIDNPAGYRSPVSQPRFERVISIG